MKELKIILWVTAITLAMTAGCQSNPDTEPKNITGGEIFTGELKGSEFSIGTGNEMRIILDNVEHWNRLDAEALKTNRADIVTIQRPDGTIMKSTIEGTARYFSTLDSLTWIVDSAIPLQVSDTNIVKVLLDTRGIYYMKNGSVRRNRLFEEFTFENEILVSIRQWTAGWPD